MSWLLIGRERTYELLWWGKQGGMNVGGRSLTKRPYPSALCYPSTSPHTSTHLPTDLPRTPAPSLLHTDLTNLPSSAYVLFPCLSLLFRRQLLNRLFFFFYEWREKTRNATLPPLYSKFFLRILILIFLFFVYFWIVKSNSKIETIIKTLKKKKKNLPKFRHFTASPSFLSLPFPLSQFSYPPPLPLVRLPLAS